MPHCENASPDASGDQDDPIASLEASCPENRNFGRVLRELGGIHCGSETIDWADGDPRAQLTLRSFPELLEAGNRLEKIFSEDHLDHIGHEHQVFRDPAQPERIFKVTLSGGYGCRLSFFKADPELEERFFQPTVSLDPRSYLIRWMLINSISDFRTKLEAIMKPVPPIRELRLCVSQPILPPGDPTEAEIASHLLEAGFARVGRDAYINFGSNMVLADMAPRNARIVDGVFVPFDAIAQSFGSEVRDWALRHLGLMDENGVIE